MIKSKQMSTKGSGPRKGHDQEKQRKNYDDIDWSKKPTAPKTEQPRSKNK